MTKDYRVVAKIKNNRILSQIEASGYPSIIRFCEAMQLSYTGVVNLISLSRPAMTTKGEWCKLAVDLASALGVEPEDLFSEKQAEGFGPSRVVVREVDEYMVSLESAAPLALEVHHAIEDDDLVQKLQEPLNDRERKMIAMHYGLDGEGEHTFDEIAQEFSIGRARVWQIINKAARKMKQHADRLGFREYVN